MIIISQHAELFSLPLSFVESSLHPNVKNKQVTSNKKGTPLGHYKLMFGLPAKGLNWQIKHISN